MLDTAFEDLLNIPAAISECLHKGLFSSCPSWRLKLANFAAQARPQLQFIVQTLVHRLHVTEKRLQRKKQNGSALYHADTMRARLLEVLAAARDKLWKYVGKHMELAKQARILDATQMAALPGEIAAFPLIFSTQVQQTLLENGEWKVYRDSVTPSTPQFDVLQWWKGMAVRLPTMYRIARSILAIPHTSCDVERSFSVWKRVRSDKQQSMAEGTHKAYVSFCFNGVVPPP